MHTPIILDNTKKTIEEYNKHSINDMLQIQKRLNYLIYGTCYDDCIHLDLKTIHDVQSEKQSLMNEWDFITRVAVVISHEVLHEILQKQEGHLTSKAIDNQLIYDLEMEGYLGGSNTNLIKSNTNI
jgi:bacterioferritin (cytochrome b1)